MPGVAKAEVVKYATIAVAEEMGVALRNTALSPNIRDRQDFSCAAATAKGEVVAQAEHIPVHLGSLYVGVTNLLRHLESRGIELEPGDVVVTNDPYIAGTHLNDVMALKPVYRSGELIGYVVCKAHHVDVGGSTPGSISVDASSLLEEGLVLPPVKLVERGKLREDVLAIVQSNVRTPRYARGDLLAQVAALNVGEKRLLELAEKVGTEALEGAWEEALRYVERYARKRLIELEEKFSARGAYEAEDFVELSSGYPARIRALVELRGGSINIDFSGSHPQVPEPLNAVYGVTVAATTFAVKAVVDPEMPMNHGFYRVVSVDAPVGSIVNPLPPAPVAGGNVETAQRIVDVVLKALSKALPGRVPAASCGTMTNVLLGGKGWVYYETVACGSGARPFGDGVDGVHTHMTNTLNTPVEVVERETPLLFVAYELRPDSGGAGRYRGGLGITRAFKVLEDGVTLVVYSERHLLRPWGLAGGKEGAPSDHFVVKRDGSIVRLGAKARVTLSRGDLVVINTPGGGGYGNPCERAREAVLRDLAEGKVSRERVAADYCQEDQLS